MMMDLRQRFCELLKEIGPGRMMNTPYDTAWVARLGEIDKSLSDQAMAWICENQLPDGSWGALQPCYYHDRVICTLAAMTVLTRRGRRAKDRQQLARGQEALERITGSATQGLLGDPGGATIGFEMIAPTLVAEAEALGIIQRQGERILGRLTRQRAAKLALLDGQMINRFATAAFSAEMAGPDGMRLLDVDNLQESNGSVGNCPSATAYFITHVRPGDAAGLRYLQGVVSKGGAPNVAPFDVFEPAWTLWNLRLTGPLDDELRSLCQPHINFLQAAWKPGKGVGPGADYTPKDSDDTSVTYEVLTHFDRSVDLEAILAYEHEGHFRCFKIESNPSISANIHVLGALRHAGLWVQHPSIRKVLGFLRGVRTDEAYWFDKWHASPYYATSHAVIACAGFADELAENAVNWLLTTQNPDGSWGYYGPSAEETAYCLQALAIWKRTGKPVPKDKLELGAAWLTDHFRPPYPPLWIGKCLYCPTLVVSSAILSALMLVKQ
jgi:halimadienyl-diphosphate synthase